MAAVVSVVGAYCTGEINLGSALQTTVTAVLSVFIRDGVSPIFGSQPEKQNASSPGA